MFDHITTYHAFEVSSRGTSNHVVCLTSTLCITDFLLGEGFLILFDHLDEICVGRCGADNGQVSLSLERFGVVVVQTALDPSEMDGLRFGVDGEDVVHVFIHNAVPLAYFCEQKNVGESFLVQEHVTKIR